MVPGIPRRARPGSGSRVRWFVVLERAKGGYVRDMHCHILPGVDDGAGDLDMSVAMLEAARDAGVTSIVCTPHVRDPYFDYDAMRTAFDALRPHAEAMGLPLTMGFEVAHAKLVELGVEEWAPRLAFEGTGEFLLELDPGCAEVSFREYEPDLEALMTIASTNSPSLRSLNASAEAAKAYVDYTICRLYPRISLGLTFDASGTDFPLLWNYAAAGNVAQSLFTAGDRNRRIEEAVAQMRIARSQVAAAEQKLYNELKVAVLNSVRAVKSLETARLAEKAAQENYDIVAQRYAVQMATALERTDAQIQLSTAKANVIAADYDYRDTQIQIAYLLGE